MGGLKVSGEFCLCLCMPLRESQLPCTVRAMYLGAMSHGSAAMSHGLSCHVPPAWLPCSPNKFPWRPIPARKGCFISQTGSCLTCFLWVMTCLAHSFLVFTPSRRPTMGWGDAGWPPTNPQSPAYLRWGVFAPAAGPPTPSLYLREGAQPPIFFVPSYCY